MDAQIDKLHLQITTEINAQPEKIDKISEALERLKKASQEKWGELSEASSKLQTATSSLAVGNKNLGDSATKASFGLDKLILSIKRITFYRLVRRIVQLLTKELATSIQNFVRFDEETNRAISNLQSSWKAFGNSVGILFAQLINTAAPILIYILDLATKVANTISLVFATIAGKEYYSKAIKYQTDYAESIEKTNNQLLDFDKFNVLQKQQEVSPLEMFETEEVATAWADMSEGTLLLITALETLVAIKLVSWAGEGITALSALAKGMATAEGATKALSLASTLLLAAGLFLIIYAINQLVTKFDDLSGGMKAFYSVLIAAGVALVIFSNKTLLTAIASVSSLTTAFVLLALAVGAVVAAVYIFANWDSFNSQTKSTITLIATLTTVLLTAALAALALKSSLTLGTAVPIIVAAVAAGAVAIKGIVGAATGEYQFFAGGGIPDTRGGSAFVMNERGIPELLHENSKGQVQVSNQESLRGAFLDALRQHEAESGSSGQTDREITLRFIPERFGEMVVVEANRQYARGNKIRV